MNIWVQRDAAAKINLNLHVIGQRADGYHNLQSLVVFTELADHVQARPAAQDRFQIIGPFASRLEAGQPNLVRQAVDLFRNRWPTGLPDALEIRLTKNLPVSAGLGGGSSDAAAMLHILCDLSPHSIGQDELRGLAAKLGADVPVCLSTLPQLMQGVGEDLKQLSPLPRLEMVLINPGVAVPTPEVFAALKQKTNSSLPAMPSHFAHPQALTLWLVQTRNDLYAPAGALVPEIEPIVEFLAEQPGCLLARMSGSGASVFGLFANGDAAGKSARAARKIWPPYWIEQTRTL